MQTYEYKFVHTSRANDIIGAMNAAGKDGWKALAVMDVGHDYSVLLMKEHGYYEDLSEFKCVGEIQSSLPDAVSPTRLPPDPNIPWATGGKPGVL